MTREQIEQLRDEAGAAGDSEQVRLCELALPTFGRTPARFDRERAENALSQCVRVISDAEAMVEPEDDALRARAARHEAPSSSGEDAPSMGGDTGSNPVGVTARAAGTPSPVPGERSTGATSGAHLVATFHNPTRPR